MLECIEEVKTKQCSKCGMIKPLTEFNKHTQTKDGLQPLCKTCGIRLRHECRKRHRVQNENGFLDNEKYCPYCKQIKPRTAFNKNKAQRGGLDVYCLDCRYKIQKLNRNHVYVSASCCLGQLLKKNGFAKRYRGFKYFGCPSVEFFVNYIESLLPQGMKIEDMKSHYHIDHIRPKASFDLTIEENHYILWHYTNLRPILAEENMRKSSYWNGCRWVKGKPVGKTLQLFS